MGGGGFRNRPVIWLMVLLIVVLVVLSRTGSDDDSREKTRCVFSVHRVAVFLVVRFFITRCHPLKKQGDDNSMVQL